jgi:hypothetical protein
MPIHDLPSVLAIYNEVIRLLPGTSIPAPGVRSGSHLTRCWREMDSNFRFRTKSAPLFRDSSPVSHDGLTFRSRPGNARAAPWRQQIGAGPYPAGSPLHTKGNAIDQSMRFRGRWSPTRPAHPRGATCGSHGVCASSAGCGRCARTPARRWRTPSPIAAPQVKIERDIGVATADEGLGGSSYYCGWPLLRSFI